MGVAVFCINYLNDQHYYQYGKRLLHNHSTVCCRLDLQHSWCVTIKTINAKRLASNFVGHATINTGDTHLVATKSHWRNKFGRHQSKISQSLAFLKWESSSTTIQLPTRQLVSVATAETILTHVSVTSSAFMSSQH